MKRLTSIQPVYYLALVRDTEGHLWNLSTPLEGTKVRSLVMVSKLKSGQTPVHRTKKYLRKLASIINKLPDSWWNQDLGSSDLKLNKATLMYLCVAPAFSNAVFTTKEES